MGVTMYKAASAALVLALAVAAAPASHTPKAIPTSSPGPQYPLITRVVSKPFCTALHRTIQPAVEALLINDQTIGRSRPLFDDLNKYTGNPESQGMLDMTYMRMSNLVGPMVSSFKAIDKLLDNTAVFHYPPRNDDDRRLLELRDHLIQIRDDQEASLDVINGYAQTQQMGEMQQEGVSEAKSMAASDTTTTMATTTPNPMFQDANAPGLPPDPYQVNPVAIPGMSLGANPISRMIGALAWTQGQAQNHEAPAAAIIFAGVRECTAHAAAPPAAKH
jgi:hypothetical protein